MDSPTLTSAILGPLSTYIFKMENMPIGSGMVPVGLWDNPTMQLWSHWQRRNYPIFKYLLHFILPGF